MLPWTLYEKADWKVILTDKTHFMSNYRSPFSHGLMFHYFHRNGHDPKDQGSISAEQFEKMLLWVGLENILSPEEWIYRLCNNSLRASDLCITFDDGLGYQYDVCLPILEKYQIRCFWFVYSCVFEGILGKMDIYRVLRTRCFSSIAHFYKYFFRKVEEYLGKSLDFVGYDLYYEQKKAKFPFYSDNDIMYRFIRDEILGREKYENLMDPIVEDAGLLNNNELLNKLWLTNEQIKDLSDKGHSIGLHSYDHPTAITQLSYEEQLSQYNKNLKHIQSACNKRPIAMSHPCGAYNEQSIRILQTLGIKCGFLSSMVVGKGDGMISPLKMPRQDSTNILKMIRSKRDKIIH